MSQTVDSKVVEMSFDNRQFEQNVGTSLSTLDKLKQALRFDGVAQGMEGINAAAKGVDMGALGGAVETVHAKFSAMEVVAMTALSNITNSAVNAGKQLIKSFTIDPVKDGFAEYELKMASVQTIMAGSGASVEEVNGYLNELNTYSDKTIYSFKDMTASIGKFTNAGVELGTAVDAIQGIANEAARSGANANEASRAMYNFSQALSTGSVKLIDWKSIENANMATVEFKQELLDTAVALGTVVKDGENYKTTTTNIQGKTSDAFNAINDFNGALQYQWLTSDVLTETLSHYAKNVDEMTQSEKEAYEESLRKKGFDEDRIAQIEKLGIESSKSATEVKTFSMMMDALKEAVGSGWAQTFELIFGNLDEAKALWTGINDVIGGFVDKTSDARNNMLSGWKELGGREQLIIALKNAFAGLVSVINPIKEAFREFFPPATHKQLLDLTANFAKFTKRMKLSEESMANLKNTFRGVFAVLSLIPKAFGLITKAIFPAQAASGGLLSAILKVTGAIGNVIANTIEWAEQSGFLEKAISTISSVVVPVFNTVKDAVVGAFEKVKEFLSTNIEMPDLSSFQSAGDIFHYVLDTLSNLKDNLPSVSEIGSTIKKTFEDAIGSFKLDDKAISGSAGKVGGIFDKFLGDPNDLKTKAAKSAQSFGEGLMQGLASIDIEKVLSGAKVGLLAYIVLQIAGIFRNLNKITSGAAKTAKTLKKIPGKVVGILDKVKGTMVSMQNDIRANILLKVAIAIGILTASIIALTFVDSQKLANVAVDLALVIGVVAILAAVIGKIVNNGGGDKAENPLVGVLNNFLDGVKKAAKKALSVVSKAAAFTLVAAAIGILAATFLKLAQMKDDFNGAMAATAIMIGLGVGLVALVKYLNQVSDKFDIKSAVAIFAIATAVSKLGKVFMALSTLSFDQIVTSLIGMAGMLGMFAMFAKSLSKSDLTKATAGLGMMTLALLALTPVVILFGSLSEVAMAGVVVVGALGLVMSGIAALAGMIGKNFESGVIKGVAAMMLLAVTIDILAPAIVLLGAVAPIASKGLFVIAGALALLVTFGAISGIPLVTAGLTALSIVLVSLGASMLMAGAGCVLFAAGLKGLLAVAAVVVAAIVAVFLGIKEGASHIPELGVTIANGIVNIITFIGQLIISMAPVIFEKIEAIAAQLPGWLMTVFPKIVAGLIALGIRILVTIGNLLLSVQAFIAGALKGLWAGIVQGIGSAIGPIGNAIKGLFMGFINLIVDGLGGLAAKIPVVGDDIKAGMDSWRDELFESLNPEEGKEKVEQYGQGLQEGANKASGDLEKTATDSAAGVTKAFDDTLADSSDSGKDFIHAQAKGIESEAPEATAAAEDSAQAMLASMTGSTDGAGSEMAQNFFGDFSGSMEDMMPDVGTDFGTMLSDTLGKGADSVDFTAMFDGKGTDIVGGLTNSVDGSAGMFGISMENLAGTGEEGFDGQLGIASPSKVMAEKGTYIVEGLVQGVKKGESSVQKEFRKLATRGINAIKSQGSAFKASGVQSATQFVNGVISKSGDASSAGSKMAGEVANGANGEYSSLKTSGQNTAQGLLDGLDSKTSEFKAMGKKHAEAYNNSYKHNQDQHSPSRVTRRMGRFTGEGLILGLKDSLRGIGEAGAAAGEKVSESIKTPLTRMLAAMDTEVDLNPTIRPVLDISDIEKNAGKIGALMPTRSFGLSFSAASAMPGATFRMTNEDVVMAVNGLRRDLKDMPRGNTTVVNGVTYDDGSNVSSAVRDLIRAAKLERRA